MVPTRTFHPLLPPINHLLLLSSFSFHTRSFSSLPPSTRSTRGNLNLLSKYSSSNPPPSSSSSSLNRPGLPIPQPSLPHSPQTPSPLKDVVQPIAPASVAPAMASFSRSGDREAKRPGGVDDAFVVEGVKVPERPLKPGEEDCCMSGCVHCIYDIYSSSLLAYQTALSEAHSALLSSSRPREEWPQVIREREERGVGPEGAKELKEAMEEMMDPTMKAFLEMEGRLKLAKKVVEEKGGG